MPDITLDILKDARSFINDGWIKGSYVDRGNVCAIGGIRQALYLHNMSPYHLDDKSGKTKESCLASYLVPHISSGDLSEVRSAHFAQYPEQRVISFNDAHATTKYDVLTIFDKAIAKYEKEHADA